MVEYKAYGNSGIVLWKWLEWRVNIIIFVVYILFIDVK